VGGSVPAEPELSLYDETLLADGDRRNVVDKYATGDTSHRA